MKRRSDRQSISILKAHQANTWRATADETDGWCRSIAASYERPIHEVRAWPLDAIHEEAVRYLAQRIVRDAAALKDASSAERTKFRAAAKQDAYKALVQQYFRKHSKG